MGVKQNKILGNKSKIETEYQQGHSSDSEYTVSYTHLDVYKRQTLHSQLEWQIGLLKDSYSNV